MEQLIGAHTSIRGGVSAAVDLAQSLNFNTMQIFTKNNNRWYSKPLSSEEISSYKEKLAKSGIKMVIAHDSYLINLCATDESMLLKSIESFIDELTRCDQLDIPYLNFHPGSHCGAGEQAGIDAIARSINLAHQHTPGFKVSSMIELTAGQGSAIGHRFEHAKSIIDLIDEKDRMSVCIDTAHIFAAGYDIRDKSSYEKTMDEFDRIIGLERLKCFHFNDSKKSLGSHVDRHDHIGQGQIGLEGFRNILNDKRFTHIPKILETPKGKEQLEDLENIRVLKSLIERQQS